MKNIAKTQEEWVQYHKDHPIETFIDDILFEITYYLYRVPLGWYITYIKFPYQRVFRGYDDNMIWEYKTVHTRMILDILRYYRHNRLGTPSIYKEKEYNKLLDTAITGFNCYLQMEDMWGNEKDYKKLEKVFKKGLEAYSEIYQCLWD